MFAEAVAAIDNGDLGGLRALLAAHPEVLSARLENGREDYFARPYLLHCISGSGHTLGDMVRFNEAVDRF